MSSYITFVYGGIPLGNKTAIWRVWTKDEHAIIGQVRWFAPWRKYCFFPSLDTVFEEVCLRDIASFVEARTREHRAARKTA
jgi:hypothetical protein